MPATEWYLSCAYVLYCRVLRGRFGLCLRRFFVVCVACKHALVQTWLPRVSALLPPEPDLGPCSLVGGCSLTSVWVRLMCSNCGCNGAKTHLPAKPLNLGVHGYARSCPCAGPLCPRLVSGGFGEVVEIPCGTRIKAGLALVSDFSTGTERLQEATAR